MSFFSYSIVSYLYVSCSGSTTSVEGEIVNFYCNCILVIMWFLLERFSS